MTRTKTRTISDAIAERNPENTVPFESLDVKDLPEKKENRQEDAL